MEDSSLESIPTDEPCDIEINMSQILNQRLKEIEDENRVRELRNAYANSKSDSKAEQPNFASNFFLNVVKTLRMIKLFIVI